MSRPRYCTTGRPLGDLDCGQLDLLETRDEFQRHRLEAAGAGAEQREGSRG